MAFKFKPDVSQEDQQHLIKEMMALKDGCKDKDGKTYIQVGSISESALSIMHIVREYPD